MHYNPYGTTNINLSCIGFGGMRLDTATSLDERAALVVSAYEKGINYFDTAPGYPESEQVFGLAFKTMKADRDRQPFFVSSKTMRGQPGGVRRDLETSLSRMGLDSIDFYHLWCVMSLDDYQRRIRGGVLKTLENLKREGLIRHICVSSHMAGDDIEQMLRDYPFDGVLLGYSAMNAAYRENGLEAAASLNRGIAVMNPLGGGIIPQNPERFRFLITQPGETAVEGALRFLLNDSRISLSLVGFGNEAELQEALRAVDGYQPISDERLAAMKSALSDAMNALCTGCRYCDSCPEEIPVPKMMDAYNQLLLVGKNQPMLDRLRWHWGLLPMEKHHFNRCTRCGQCEDLCTQHLPIRERLQEIDAAVARYRSTLSKRTVVTHTARSLLKKVRTRVSGLRRSR